MPSASSCKSGDRMNPLIATVLTRVLAGAATAAVVPTAMNAEPSAPLPSSMEEAIAQAIMALIVVGTMHLQKRKTTQNGKG